jgi:hypothetical protein
MLPRRKKQTSARDRELERAERERLETALEAGLLGTFPASDAVAVTQPVAEPNVHWLRAGAQHDWHPIKPT